MVSHVHHIIKLAEGPPTMHRKDARMMLAPLTIRATYEQDDGKIVDIDAQLGYINTRRIATVQRLMREAGYTLDTKFYTNGERAYVIEMKPDAEKA